MVTGDVLLAVCSSITEGNIPGSIATYLSAARLIALPKSNGDVRPIAIGEVFRHITARAICQQKKSFATFLSAFQHGVATEGGIEMLIHHSQMVLENNSDWVVIKLIFSMLSTCDIINNMIEVR